MNNPIEATKVIIKECLEAVSPTPDVDARADQLMAVIEMRTTLRLMLAQPDTVREKLGRVLESNDDTDQLARRLADSADPRQYTMALQEEAVAVMTEWLQKVGPRLDRARLSELSARLEKLTSRAD